MAKTGQFLITISGARPEVLAECPSERIKFQSLGWAILITCGMATVSMWFALTSAMGFSPAASFPIAVLWGLIIMGIDRWLVTSMSTDEKRKFFVAAPRLALAILLGSLISTPIVLRIFESEINNQISVIKQNNEAAFLGSQQKSQVQARVTKWQNTVKNLQQVIDSHGAKAINPASDPVVQGLTTQLNAARKTEATDYKEWQCQLYGGCGAPKGNGPLAQASQTRYDKDVAEVNSLTQRIQAREQALQATDASSQAKRLQQAESALPNADAQLKAAQAEENSLLNNFQATNKATNGLLIRLKALDQISAGNSTLQLARILLFLLFLVIEVLPVTVKLLQPAGNYERILRAKVENELREAQWNMRGAAGTAGLSQPADDLHPGMSDRGPAGRRRTLRAHDPLDEELAQVWEQHTRMEPMPSWESQADTGHFQTPPDQTGPNRLDDILRGIPDTRQFDDIDDRQNGIERLYSDEDL